MSDGLDPPSITDSALIARLRQGDESAFDQVFRSEYAALVRFTEAFIHDRAVAEELVQDVMLGLWRGRDTFSAAGSLRGYLFRAARNRALNHIRHEKIEQRSRPLVAPETVVRPVGDSRIAEQEIDAAVRAAIDDLPERCRQVFQLSRNHGLKYGEIAAALEISVKTVETQMGKALRTLRERLRPYLPEGREL